MIVPLIKTPKSVAFAAATRAALERDADNSYLPFTGSAELRKLVAERIFRQSGHRLNAETEVVITAGGTEGMFDALLAATALLACYIPGRRGMRVDPLVVLREE